MTLEQAMSELESRGSEKMRANNVKGGYATDNQFGVMMGDIRTVAKAIKSDHSLALQLWDTGNYDARLLACLIVKPKELIDDELDRMVRSIEFSPAEDYSQLGDWLNNYVVKQHPNREALRLKWLADSHPMAARAAWSLTTDRIGKSPEGLDLGALLGRIANEMKDAEPPAKWLMNFALIELGVRHPSLRDEAMRIGEELGVYRNFPTPKGCTSPFAPIAIRALAKD